MNLGLVVADMGKRILVLCTGNSCRSQMAHGYLKTFAPEGTEVYSAGVEAHGLNQDAVRAMQRDGIDISGHTSNLADEYEGMKFDYLITVCDHAREQCPYFATKAVRFHRDFQDPSKFEGGEAEKDARFDEARNEIRRYCKEFVHAYLQ